MPKLCTGEILSFLDLHTPRDADAHPLGPKEPDLSACDAAAAQGVAVSGKRAGQRARRLVVGSSSPPQAGSAEPPSDEPLAEVSGISLQRAPVLFEGQGLIARLISAIPPPRFHLVRCFGVLSIHSAQRSELVPTPRLDPASHAPPQAPGELLTLIPVLVAAAP